MENTDKRRTLRIQRRSSFRVVPSFFWLNPSDSMGVGQSWTRREQSNLNLSCPSGQKIKLKLVIEHRHGDAMVRENRNWTGEEKGIELTQLTYMQSKLRCGGCRKTRWINSFFVFGGVLNTPLLLPLLLLSWSTIDGISCSCSLSMTESAKL